MKFRIVISAICFASIAHAISVPTQLQTVTDKAVKQLDQLKQNIFGAPTAPRTQKVKAKLDQQTLENMVSFLSTNIAYKGYPDAQAGFLNRAQKDLGFSDTQKENILNMVKQRELRDKQGI